MTMRRLLSGAAGTLTLTTRRAAMMMLLMLLTMTAQTAWAADNFVDNGVGTKQGAQSPQTEQSGEATPIGEDPEISPVVPEDKTSDNLADFLKAVSFNAPKNEGGAYVVTPGTSYQFVLTFAERYGNNDTLQFPNDNSDMTYNLPEGLEVADGLEGTFTISVKDGANTYRITDNTYRVDGRVLTVNFNSSHEYFGKLTAASNAQFTLSFEGSISKNTDKLVFAEGIEMAIEIAISNYVTVLKSSKVDFNDKEIAYTVTVQSHGNSENVHVEDQISSSVNGLITELSDFSIMSSIASHDISEITPVNENFQFEYVIPQMYDGEVITISYKAAFDPAKLSSDENGRYIGVVSNTAEAWSDGAPEHEQAPVETTIDYTPTVSKSKGEITAINGKKQTLKWSIVANENPVVSMAGTTITDNIDTGSQSIMKHSGDGIAVEVRDNQNDVVRTDNLTWDQLVQKTDATWSYKVPDSDAGEAYTYIITYYTEVDLTGIMSTTTVSNGVQTSAGKTSNNSVSVTPGDGVVTVSKEATNVDLDIMRITWKVTFNVPAEGLSKAAFGDNYPQRYISGVKHEEKIIPGSVQVTGLINNEYVRMRQQNANTIWLTVIKALDSGTVLEAYSEESHTGYDSNARVRYVQQIENTYEDPISAQEIEGCDPSDNDRIITLTFDTAIDSEWLSASETETALLNHTNSGKLLINNDPGKAVSATAVVVPRTVEKTGMYVGARTVNGVKLPVYKYEVVISNVHSDEIEITDDFDTSLLEYYTGTEGGVESWLSGYIFGGGILSQNTRGGKFSVVYTNTGIRITTNTPNVPHDANSVTGYYGKYKFVYYLTIKDETALNLLIARAAANDGGVYRIHNSAKYNGISGGTDVAYEYVGLKKELLTADEDLIKTDEDIWPEFRISINDGEQLLNGGEPLTMTDTGTNLSLDITTILAEPSEGVTWDMTDNTVTYTIPDATRVVITYRARVTMATMPEVGSSQSITFSNRVEMKGYSDEVEKTAERRNAGQGSASIASFNLIMYEAGNMNKRLSGAKFQLQDQDEKPVRDKNGKPVEFVSDDDGMITIKGDLGNLGWVINEGEKYYLEELEAPTGYILAKSKFQFTVSADGTTDYSHYIYYSGYIMTVKNYPGTDVRVQKTWTNGNQRHDADNVEVTLQQKKGWDGEWTNVIRMETDDGWTDLQSRTLTLDKDNNWAGIFYELPLVVPVDLENENDEYIDVTYRVVETKVNGQDPDNDKVEVTGGKAQDSGTYVYEITNEVETGSLKVSKVLATGSEAYTDQEFSFTVTLADRTISGEYGAMTFADGVAAVVLKGGESATATGLTAGITYTVTEAQTEGFHNTQKTGDTGTITKDVTSEATFTNARNTVSLADDAPNNLDAINGYFADVTLAGRTLYKDGAWNTLCLPFSVDDFTGTPLEGATVMELDTDGDYSGNQTGFDATDGTLYLYFKDATSIVAGKSYIVKWASGSNIVSPVFYGVTFDIGTPTDGKYIVEAKNSGLNAVQFIGSYSPVALTPNDMSNLFLGTSTDAQNQKKSTLYYPSAANNNDGKYHVNACRAYFHVDLTGNVNAVRAFYLNFGDEDEMTGITTTDFTNKAGAWFDLSGRKLNGKPTTKGIYVNNDKKVVIK